MACRSDAMKPPLKGYSTDDFQTPPAALKPLLPYLKKQWLIWECACIVTNPPYSLKQQFLERAYSLKKPFAFLLPLTTLETTKRLYLFQKHCIEIIFLNERINFVMPRKKKQSKSWFASAWFTNGLGIGKQLVFPLIKDIPKQTKLSGNQSIKMLGVKGDE
jgi:hypothetical protein